MKMKLANVIYTCFTIINQHIRLSLAILYILICARQGSSTVVPIGSCILIYGESCPRSEIQFYLFTRSNPNNSELVYFSDVFDNVTSSSFNASLPNKIIVHGYNADMNLDVVQNIKTAYLKRGDYNVWFVNWPDLCRGPCYVISVYNLEQVGQCVAQMIKRLRKYMGAGEPDVHLIGFSLGAHVAAYTARHLRPWKLPRITGLDPAMPMFAGRDRDNRLDSEDAKFVDVIHTSAFVQGQYARSGHVDFYMNGGIEQPGCWNASNMFDCNHRRAPQYFAESINSVEGFWGWPCSGMLNYILDMCPMKQPTKLMGEECSQSSRGFYIVPTKASPPFSRGPLMIASDTPFTSKSKISSTTSSENSIIPVGEKKNRAGKAYNSPPKAGKAYSSPPRTSKSRKLEVTQVSTNEATSTSMRTKETTSTSIITNEAASTSMITNEAASTSMITNEAATTSMITNEAATTSMITNEAASTTSSNSHNEEMMASSDAITETTTDIDEDIYASSVEDSESTDSRFVNLDTEIEFAEDEPSSTTARTSTTTTHKSKYRFIQRVPRPRKNA